MSYLFVLYKILFSYIKLETFMNIPITKLTNSNKQRRVGGKKYKHNYTPKIDNKESHYHLKIATSPSSQTIKKTNS